MSLHKAVVLVVAVGCSQAPPAPEVLAGGTTRASTPAISLGSASLQTRAETAVWLTPAPGGKRIGTLAAGARVRGATAVTGEGCVLGWVGLTPRGYVCGDLLDLSPEPPWTDAASDVAKPEATTPVLAKAPAFAGYVLADHGASLPIGVVAGPSGAAVWQAATPTRATRFMPYRAFVPVLATKWQSVRVTKPVTKPVAKSGVKPAKPPPPPAPQAEAYRIGVDEWVTARGLRVVNKVSPPPGYRDEERWVDVDLDAQTLTAYEGLKPVFVTLVSTGLDVAPTPTGVFRIWKKLVATDAQPLADVNLVAKGMTVAWAQLFVPEAGVGIYPRSARDRLGNKDSRGGVLVAPGDAVWLYRWTTPAHAAGWTMSAGVIESPGTLIQLRSRQDPTPRLRGYAMTVAERDLGY